MIFSPLPNCNTLANRHSLLKIDATNSKFSILSPNLETWSSDSCAVSHSAQQSSLRSHWAYCFSFRKAPTEDYVWMLHHHILNQRCMLSQVQVSLHGFIYWTLFIQRISQVFKRALRPQEATEQLHQGNMACCISPVVSGTPMMRLRFWRAWPDAPFTRLSRTAQPSPLSVNNARNRSQAVC